jgi:dihydrofolate synthase/folylpolyglutamate synthase
VRYCDAIQKLDQNGPELPPSSATPVKFSLDNIRTLLAALGDPQATFPSVLIAGTNGKGSTAATLASICAAAGLRTGLYTSPHLARVNERIRLTGEAGNPALPPISDEAFAAAYTRVDDAAEQLVGDGRLPHGPSFFERLTAMAFVVFAEQRVDVAVLEVGLGGRLDATNTVEPLVSVITDIAMDHMEYLGHTLREIAGEKAGILRQGGVLVTLSQHPEANAAIGERAMALNVRGVDAARCLPPQMSKAAEAQIAGGAGVAGTLPANRYELSIGAAEGFAGERLQVDSPLAGRHQQRNLALALATAIELRTNHLEAQPKFAALTNAAMARGIAQTDWPGRLELMASGEGAPLLLDVAHNPAGAWTLRSALAELDESRPRTLLFSCLADKQLREMAQVLFPLFDARSGDALRAHDHIVLAPIANPRAATVEQLLEVAHALGVQAHAAPHLAAAFAQARQITPANGIIVATGSVYLVGEVRALAESAPVTHGAEPLS